MEKTKVTKKEMYGRLIEIVEGANVQDVEAIVEFLNHEIELVSKKRNTQTKIQKANVALIEKVYEAIAEADKEVSIAEIYEMVRDVEGITSANKVNALVKKLKDDGRVTRTENKKKAFFSIAQ